MSIKILLVDDDAMNLEILSIMQESQGHHCLKACNGQEALDILEENRDTDIIILDLEMPVMDGFQMLVELKKRPYLKDIPVIVVSVKHTDVLKTLQLGANDFVSKPYSAEELEVRICNQIAARRAAESAQRSKNQFMSIVSHELRTPMNGIIGMADYMLESEISPQHLHSLGIIKESAHELLKIVNNILDYTNAEDSYKSQPLLPYKIQESAEQALEEMKTVAVEKGLALLLDVAPDLPETVLGHWTRFTKALVNLVDNAIKFTSSGQISITIRIESVVGDDLCLVCSVKDTGIGIPKDIQQSIFNPFVQVDGSYTRRFGGMGLGLTVSRQLVESMGGKMTVASTPGNGCTFTFTFHVKLMPEPATATTPVEMTSSVRLSVLLAEDAQINQLVATRLLEKLGHHVEIAGNGVETVAKWQRGGFNLIIMDIQMPMMDGYQATEFIRAEEKKNGGHIPIIALTANVLEDDEIHCLSTGMDGYLTKPLKKDSLAKAICRLFEHS
jgi:CheY-like chemotaxis protein